MVKEMSREEKQVQIDFNETFNTVHGERVIKHLKKRFNYDTIIWKRDTLGRIDPYDVTIRAAQKVVINFIERNINDKSAT